MVVAHDISRTGRTPAFARQYRGYGIVDVDQIEPRFGIFCDDESRAERFDSRRKPSGSVNTRQPQKVRIGNSVAEKILSIKADFSVLGFGSAFGRFVHPFAGVLAVDA